MSYWDETDDLDEMSLESEEEKVERWGAMNPQEIANEVMLQSMAKGLLGRKINLQGISGVLKLYMSHHNLEQGAMIDLEVDIPKNLSTAEKLEHLVALRTGNKLRSNQFKDLLSGIRAEVEYCRLPILEKMAASLEAVAHDRGNSVVIEYRQEGEIGYEESNEKANEAGHEKKRDA